MDADMAREADVARRTRTDATWHVGPRGRACESTWTHGSRPRESTRMPVRGATWHEEGPQVSGPW